MLNNNMKRLWLIFAALFFLSCGGSSSYIEAEVLVGIHMTQTAVANVQPPAQILAPPPVRATIPPPTATPAPLDLGAARRILLQTGRCIPSGSKDCQWEHSAIYTCDQNGDDLQQVIEAGELIGVSSDDLQGLLSLPNPDLQTSTLSLVDLATFTQVQLAQNYRHTYTCDGNHCAAIWLADGKIAFIGENKGQNNQPEVNIFLVNADGTGARPLLAQAPSHKPLYLYRSYDAERFYWEAGSGAVSEGIFSMRMDGSDLRQESGVIDPSFSPSGKYVAFLKIANELGYQTTLSISSTDWANPSQIYTPQIGEYIDQYLWSPDGERLVFQVSMCAATCTSKHYYWKVGATTLKELPASIGFIQASPFWTGDGRYVLYNSRNQSSGKHTFSALNSETFSVQPFLEKLALADEGSEVEYLYAIP